MKVLMNIKHIRRKAKQNSNQMNWPRKKCCT